MAFIKLNLWTNIMDKLTLWADTVPTVGHKRLVKPRERFGPQTEVRERFSSSNPLLLILRRKEKSLTLLFVNKYIYVYQEK